MGDGQSTSRGSRGRVGTAVARLVLATGSSGGGAVWAADLPLDVQDTSVGHPQSRALPLELLRGVVAQVDLEAERVALHSGSGVDSVPEETVPRVQLPDHRRHHRTAVDPDPDRHIAHLRIGLQLTEEWRRSETGSEAVACANHQCNHSSTLAGARKRQQHQAAEGAAGA